MSEILFVADECIFPANSGGRIVRYDRIAALCKNNNVHLLVVVKKRQLEEMNGCPLYECCKSITVVQRENRFISLFKGLFMPYRVAAKTGKSVKLEFKRILANNSIDIIVFEEPCVALLGKDVNKPQIIDSDNVEFESLLSQSKRVRNPLKRFIYRHEYRLMKRYESKIYNCKNIAGGTFISPLDLKRYDDVFNISARMKTVVINHGFHPHKPSSNLLEEKNVATFIASMDYLPNEEAAIWLATEVMPKVIDVNKEACLLLVGKNPSQRLKNLSSKNIVVVGGVESVEDYYRRSSVALVPIFSGGGVKIKLIEAASYNKIIMSTSFGLKGSMFDNTEVVVSNDAESFAGNLIDILSNNQKYESFRNRSFEKFTVEYNLDSNMHKYCLFIESFARKQ